MQPEKQRSNLIAQVCVSIALGLAGAAAWVWAVGIDELLAFGSDRKPMSPVTIFLWLLIGMVLLFLKRVPNSRLTLRLARGVAVVSGMAGVLIMLRYCFDWGSPVEAWLVHTASHVGNFPVGYISSQGGTMLVIVALALGLRQPVGRNARLARMRSQAVRGGHDRIWLVRGGELLLRNAMGDGDYSKSDAVSGWPDFCFSRDWIVDAGGKLFVTNGTATGGNCDFGGVGRWCRYGLRDAAFAGARPG